MLKWLRKLNPFRRSLENPQVPLTLPWYGPPTLAGIQINDQTAYSIAAFSDGVRLISADVAARRIQPLRHNHALGGCEPATDHWSYDLVVHSPDGTRPAIRFWATIMQHAIARGNGYAEIVRKPNGWEGQSLNLLAPDRVMPRIVRVPTKGNSYTDKLIYDVQDADGQRRIHPWNMIHIAHPLSYDGIVGRSVIGTARESLGLSLAADISMASFYGNAARPGGLYTLPPNMSEQGIKNAREYIDELYVGPMNNGRPGFLPPGVGWNPAVLPAPDEVFLKSRAWQVGEIARWLSIPVHKLDQSAAPSASLEQAEKSYWNTGIKPWVDFICAELHMKLFQPSERSEYFFRGNWNELHFCDLATKTAYFSAGRNGGWLSVNEIKHYEGENGIGPAGDIHLSPANMLTDDQLLQQGKQPAPDPSQSPAPSMIGPTGFHSLEVPQPDKRSIDAVRDLVTNELGRLLRREVSAVKRASNKPGFSDWLLEFYGEHRNLLESSVSPSLKALSLIAGPQVSASNLADSWVGESRSELLELVSAIHSSELPAAVEDLCNRWERRIANALRVKDDNGMEHDDDGKFGSGGGGGSKKDKGTGTPTHKDAGSAEHKSLKQSFSNTLKGVAAKNPQMAEKYGNDVHHVIDRMSARCVERVKQNVKSVQWHANPKALTKTIADDFHKKGKEFPAGNTVGGCYRNSEKKLFLDGGYQEKDATKRTGSAREIYAHELAHAIDCHPGGDPSQDRISFTPEWQHAYLHELSKNQLNDYASSKITEGFAEFGRLAILRPDLAKKHFPKCWKVWQHHGLE